MTKNNYTINHYTPKQGRFPVFIADNLDICDPVLAFDEIMEEIEIWRYLKPDGYKEPGRPGYNRVNMLKTILFSFRDTGYAFCSTGAFSDFNRTQSLQILQQTL